MNLYAANYQWASRPDDERFATLDDMKNATFEYTKSARMASNVPVDSNFRVEAQDGNLALLGKANLPARLTHYAFGQLAKLVKAPADYLRSLPATLAAQNINAGLKKRQDDDSNDKLNILMHNENSNYVVRSVTTDRYDLVWNYRVITEAIQKYLVPAGWQVPPARPGRPGQAGTRKATEADILPNQGDFGLSVKVGDDIAPAGLYASDHDMFIFLVNQSDPAWDGARWLHRGVFIEQSEVGDCGLNATAFTYANVCGNHIVWDAGEVKKVRVRHIKSEEAKQGRTLENFITRWRSMSLTLPSGDKLTQDIKLARAKEIAANKEDVVTTLYKFAKVNNLTRINRTALDASYDLAERSGNYGAPTTVWGMVNGLTEYSQTGAVHTDSRTEFDRQAGRIMEIAF